MTRSSSSPSVVTGTENPKIEKGEQTCHKVPEKQLLGGENQQIPSPGRTSTLPEGSPSLCS